jgi:hypothetical protein
MFVGVDGVQADDFAGEVETKNLFLSFVINDITLETTRAYRCYGAEFVASAEQVFAWLDGAGAMNDLLKSFGFIGA